MEIYFKNIETKYPSFRGRPRITLPTVLSEDLKRAETNASRKSIKNTRERPARNFINQLTDDTNLDKEDLEVAMNDRQYWKNKVIEVRLRST